MEKASLSFWFALVVTLAALATNQVLFSKLEARHPDTFSRLGSPHTFTNNTPYKSWLFLCWVISADALLLDAVISTWVWIYRVLAGTLLVMFVLRLFNLF